MKPSQRIAIAGSMLGLSLALIPWATIARTFNPEFRACMQQAVSEQQSELLDAQQDYDNAIESALQQRQQDYINAWNNEDDRDQRDAIRDADREYRDAVNNARDEQRQRERDIRNQLRSDERACSDLGRFEDNNNSSRSSRSSSSRSSSSRSSLFSSTFSSANPFIQCQNGFDDDGDGAIDFPSDFSCNGTNDNDETNPRSACQDGFDNDGDGLVDYPGDPGCFSRQDNDETGNNQASSYSSAFSQGNGQPQCQDSIDNDGDGAVDFPSDFSCNGGLDNDETNPRAACQDGFDNDADGMVDYPSDPGCFSRQDNDESNVNQNSSLSSAFSSFNNGGQPQCQDSIDNDGDGLVDYPNDPGCTGGLDNDESNAQSGGGGDGALCFSNGDCNNAAGFRCSVDAASCFQNCPPSSQFCRDACQGRCIR